MARFLFAIVSWGAMYSLTWYIAGDFLGTMLTVSVLVLEIGFTARFFTVSVPEACGLVTVDLFKSLLRKLFADDPFYNLRVYGTGFHFRFPWEQVKDGNYINLRVIPLPFKEETYPSMNGPLVKVDWSIQVAPDITKLPRYIYVGLSNIVDGLHDVGSSFLSAEIKKKTPEEVRKSQKIIEEGLRSHFEDAAHRVDDPALVRGIARLAGKPVGHLMTLEDFYGISIVKASIADLDYSTEYQKVLESQAVTEKLKEIASSLVHGDITPKVALEQAMIVNKNVAKDIRENIQEIRGEGTEGVASFLMALANAAGGGRGGK